jgi:uncharacterized membrane protein YkvA (DUF1232 family)
VFRRLNVFEAGIARRLGILKAESRWHMARGIVYRAHALARKNQILGSGPEARHFGPLACRARSTTPLLAKLTAAAVAAYALSPIDLIPDFIPVLGYLDDLLIVPLGIMLVVKLVSKSLMEEFRAAAQLQSERPTSRTGLVFVVAVWVIAAISSGWLMMRYW